MLRMIRLERVPLRSLVEEPYGRVICYPKFDEVELARRIEELSGLGVHSVEFRGEKKLFGLPILGKGNVGIVVVAYRRGGPWALKIRRLDADRDSLVHEADLLKLANSVGVGPRLISVSRNFLLMEYIKGRYFLEWLRSMEGGDALVRKVLKGFLKQCRALDKIGLDHGELSRAHRHILVDGLSRPWIVDFETASFTRRVSNVTSLCQYFFISSEAAHFLKQRLGAVNGEELIGALRRYKRSMTDENFKEILSVCKLTGF